MGKNSIFWLVLTFFLFTSPAFATHIVGGEFELKHIEGDQYILKLILYNDDVNGNPGAIDPWAEVFVWSKRNNMRIGSYRLEIRSQTPIDYNVPNCPHLPIRTSEIVYARQITLRGGSFGDPEGYYVSYERCCRNNIIDNIQNPESTGQTFYMEFPAVMKNGAPFVNSSPELPPPPSDYLPVGEPLRFDVKATDPDNDQLVYRLTEPLAGFSSPEYPIPNMPMSRPYPKVRWLPGYGPEKMVKGNPALRISNDGFLELTPTEEGLFVFAMVVEEYRNGVKIGEVRREYQIVVYTPNNTKPEVTTSLNQYQAAEELEVELVLGERTDFTVRVADEEKNRLTLRAQGRGFSLQKMGMSFRPLTGKGSAEGVFSWQPACSLPLTDGKAEFTLYFVGEDMDICNANDQDTLIVHLTVVDRPNQQPLLEASLSGVQILDPLVFSFEANSSDELFVIDVTGSDEDVDNMLFLKLDSVSAPGKISYAWQDASGKGTVSSALTLPGLCELLDGQPEALLSFYFSVKDNPCQSKADTMSVKILVKDKFQDFPRVKYPNVFTPNGDHCNAWFEIRNLPEDACQNRFEYIRVYNRWGKLLYESADRNFRWYAENEPAGTYYYLLKYTNVEYRSPLSLVLGDAVGNDGCSNP